MNAEARQRYRGSLLERAAEAYDLMPHARPKAPVVEPKAEPEPQPEAPLEAPAAQDLEPEAVAKVPAVEPVAAEPEAQPFDLDAPLAEAEAFDDFALFDDEELGNWPRRVVTIDREHLAETGMIVPGGPVTALAEEFRLVKRQLLNTARTIRAKDADKGRMILVCSAKPNDGKTFCAINLALSLAAERDVEILLVDADFGKPDVLNRLGAAEGPGLLDVLSGDVESAEDCILDTDVPQLSILPAGTKSVADTELIASERAHAVLDGLAAANPRRIVIFDSPPILAASPASVLAAHVGQVLVVVRADKTSESDLREAVGLLDACDEIQLVLNDVSFQPGGRRYGNYGAYYSDAAE